MGMTQINEQERVRRQEHVREARAALGSNQTLAQRQAKRDAFAHCWAVWLRHRMDSTGASAIELLPDALGQIEMMIDDKVAVAIKEFKASIKEVLT